MSLDAGQLLLSFQVQRNLMRHKCIYKNSLISQQNINITHSF